MNSLIIGTRSSQLAVTQTRLATKPLASLLNIELNYITVNTKGDKDQDTPLSHFNDTGVFTRELEHKLLNDEIDIAVHSLKDLPLKQPQGLELILYPERGNPLDIMLINKNAFDESAEEFPVKENMVVGTSSQRRKSVLAWYRKDLKVKSIRGNINTRLRKLEEGQFDAVIFAAAGLERLNLDTSKFHSFTLPVSKAPPAPAQGVLALEMKRTHPLYTDIYRHYLNQKLASSAYSERRLLKLFGGGCSLPLGVYVKSLDNHGDFYNIYAFYQSTDKPRWVHCLTQNLHSGIDSVFEDLTGPVYGISDR